MEKLNIDIKDLAEHIVRGVEKRKKLIASDQDLMSTGVFLPLLDINYPCDVYKIPVFLSSVQIDRLEVYRKDISDSVRNCRNLRLTHVPPDIEDKGVHSILDHFDILYPDREFCSPYEGFFSFCLYRTETSDGFAQNVADICLEVKAMGLTMVGDWTQLLDKIEFFLLENYGFDRQCLEKKVDFDNIRKRTGLSKHLAYCKYLTDSVYILASLSCLEGDARDNLEKFRRIYVDWIKPKNDVIFQEIYKNLI